MLQLKLEAPRQPPSIVERPRLLSALSAVSGARVILLSAPAGFGKTTTLVQWRDHLLAAGEQVGWLTLDESDAEPRQLIADLIRSALAAGVDTGELATKAAMGLVEFTLDSVLRQFSDLLRRQPSRVSFIIDDYHRISTKEMAQAMERFIAVLPGNVRLLISSRARPNFDVPRLLVTGAAAEITSDTLRFTDQESRDLLDDVFDGTDLTRLIGELEGWPVALQLMKLVSLQRPNTPNPLTQLTARGGHLSSYLSDTILKGLPDHVVDFLLQTSILEKFNVDLADQVRAKTDSWHILEELTPLQSLLTSVDADSAWFRYHHLFAEYLQGQLRLRRPGEAAILHHRASIAFERLNLLPEAVWHAQMAGDLGRCAELIERAGGWRLVLFGGMSQLARLLSCVPATERLSHPRLVLAEAYLALKEGDLRRARANFDLVGADVFNPSHDWGSLDDYARDTLNVGTLIRTYDDNTIDPAFLRSFEEIRAAYPDADGLTRGVLDCAGAVAALCLGQLDYAEVLARDAMTAMRSVNSVLGLNYSFLHAGLACLFRGEVRAASAYLTQARNMAEENFGVDSGLKAVSDVFLYTLRAWRGELASGDAAALESAFRHVCDYDGWFDVYASGLDTLFWLAWTENDTAAMERIIATGASITEARQLERLRALVDAQRVLLLCVSARRERSPRLIGDLHARFPTGRWRNEPACWRPYQNVAHALALWYLRDQSEKASTLAADLLDCARACGSRLFEVRALLLSALIAHHCGDDAEAIKRMAAATAIAAPEGIVLPFIEQPALKPLLLKIRSDCWQEGGRPIEAAFLAQVAELLARRKSATPSRAMLTVREHDVMRELARGSTNKEIARALDMTEHTVKFHLKRVFAKLGVDRRAHALDLFRANGAAL
ncbi:helix-turn-helix transcriptional regulator [Rhizorhabdus sp. FW153]|uniref:helix-turn-helix transcriptional regulator n=1 Tax=Rhizorhabdus sp. FW153 TaxID=3400216 RepID=UPI003CF2FEE7